MESSSRSNFSIVEETHKYYCGARRPLSRCMNQAFANKLNEEGAILLVLDMPKGAEIGIDYNSWLVGDSFMGFKMINPGFHCLFYRW